MITKEQCDIKLEDDVVVKVSIPYPIFWKEVGIGGGDTHIVTQQIIDEYQCSKVEWGGDGINFLKTA